MGNELLVEDILHIAGQERRVINAVDGGIDLGVFNGFGHVLNAHDMAGPACHEVGYRSRTRIEVIYEFVAVEVGQRARHLVQFVGLLGVGLVETLRAHLELEVFHHLVDIVVAMEGVYLQVGKGVVALGVVHVEQRGDFGEGRMEVGHQCLCCGHLCCHIVHTELDEQHHLARGRGT